jgi:hypothetical protein
LEKLADKQEVLLEHDQKIS